MEAQDNISKQFKEAARNMESVPSFPSMERIWDKVEERLDEEQEQKKSIPFWSKGIAAAVLVLVSLSAVYLLRGDHKAENAAENIARNESTNSTPGKQSDDDKSILLPVDKEQGKTTVPAPVIASQTIKTDRSLQVPDAGNVAGIADAPAMAIPANQYHADSIQNGIAANGYAGKRKIKGLVTDENMEPVIGAMVTLKGTVTSVQTDVNGMYTIEVDSDQQLLEFKAMGMEPRNLTPAVESALVVKMKEDKTLLPEVITYGGTFDRKAFMGTLTPVYSKDIDNKPVIDIAKAIATQAPGTEIRSGGGQPGDNAFSFGQVYQYSATMPYANSRMNSANGTPELTLSDMQQSYSLKPGEKNYLGSGSTNRVQQKATPDLSLRRAGAVAGNDPLVVVDGTLFDGKLTDINPEHIASIKVVKDSTVTRLYGARSANGVIQVMTRKALEKDSPLKKGWGKAKRFMGVKKGVGSIAP